MTDRSYFRGIREDFAQDVLALPEPVDLDLLEELELESDDPDAPEPPAIAISGAAQLHLLLTGFDLWADTGPLGVVRDAAAAVRQTGLGGLLVPATMSRLVGGVVAGAAARASLIDPALTWALRGNHPVNLGERRIWICTSDDVERINRSLARLDPDELIRRYAADDGDDADTGLADLLGALADLREFYAAVPEAVEVSH